MATSITVVTQVVTMHMPPAPRGYEYTGEYRVVKVGEYFSMVPSDTVSPGPSFGCWPILRRVRPATVQIEVPWDTAERFSHTIPQRPFLEDYGTLHNAARKAVEKYG